MPVPQNRRLIYLRDQLFRYIGSVPSRAVPTLNKTWSSCSTDKEPRVDMVVTNPGTSFARVVAQKPVFANFPKFPKPCSEGEE